MIDFVITWVDGNDVKWQKDYYKYSKSSAEGDRRKLRYRDWGLLKYWFRGVSKFAPWVRKVYLVTQGHYPDWLDLECEKLEVVFHHEIMPLEHLPTFNSCAIEVNLHKIKNLSETFVYFNDDMFLTNYVSPEFFFRKGLPCHIAALNALSGGATDDAVLQGIKIINKYFSKPSVITKSLTKWFNLKYSKELIRTILLLPWPFFTGFYEPHCHMNFLKSTFDVLWEKEFEILNKTSASRFRSLGTLNPYIFKYWQIVEGNFNPSNYRRKCKYYGICNNEIIDIEKAIESMKYKVLILNDVTDELVDFEFLKLKMINSFDKILPDKSFFEK